MRSLRHNCLVEKKGQRYIFSYDHGEEYKIMAIILDLIFDEESKFSWPEATMVALDIIDNLIQERTAYIT